MIDIEIKNFQSIKKVSFKIEGFTVLIGRSNLGKSAVVRAIKCALTGASGTDFVRHGSLCERRLRGAKTCECTAVVSIKTAAFQITWEKGDNKNCYIVKKGDSEAVTYTKVGKGVPDFLLPDFEPVKIGDKSELIQVSRQFHSIFLLDESGGVAAEVLSDVAQLDSINVAMKLVAKDRRDAVSTRTVREADIKELTLDLASYDGLDTVVSRTNDVEGLGLKLRSIESDVNQLNGFIARLRQLVITVRSLQFATKPALPNSSTFHVVGSEFLSLNRFYESVVERSIPIRRLMNINRVNLPDIVSIKTNVRCIVSVCQWLNRLESLSSSLRRLGGIEGLSSLGYVNTALPKQILDELRSIIRFITQYSRISNEVSRLDKQLLEVESLEKDILDSFDALGVCPTCLLPLHMKQR